MYEFLIAIRHYLIIKLAGNMPVVINMAIISPTGFGGSMVKFPNPKGNGIFVRNYLAGRDTYLFEKHNTLLMPKKDT